MDLAQAAIGPGMAIYTRYSKVFDAEGKPLTVRHALALINETLDTALTEQEGDFDADSRWALAWFEQSAFADGDYGVAETLSKAKNTSVKGLEDARILKLGRGKVRLLKPSELLPNWDPTTAPGSNCLSMTIDWSLWSSWVKGRGVNNSFIVIHARGPGGEAIVHKSTSSGLSFRS